MSAMLYAALKTLHVLAIVLWIGGMFFAHFFLRPAAAALDPPVRLKLMHDVLSSITPQYWTFWIGLFLVVLVMVGRDRLIRPWTWFGKSAKVKS